MNHSFYSADRSTHLKIVVVALVAGIAVSGVALSLRTNPDARLPADCRRYQSWKANSDYQLGYFGYSLIGERVISTARLIPNLASTR